MDGLLLFAAQMPAAFDFDRYVFLETALFTQPLARPEVNRPSKSWERDTDINVRSAGLRINGSPAVVFFTALECAFLANGSEEDRELAVFRRSMCSARGFLVHAEVRLFEAGLQQAKRKTHPFYNTIES